MYIVTQKNVSQLYGQMYDNISTISYSDRIGRTILFSLHNTHTHTHTNTSCMHINITCTYFPDIISLKVSDIEDDAALTTDVETPNTIGRNLLRRLGLAQGSEAEATSTSSNNNVNNQFCLYALHYTCTDNILLHVLSVHF